MKRISLILAVAMFGISVGGAAAQAPPVGETPDAGHQAINRIEEDRTVADREDSGRNVTREWLSEPPGVDTPPASVSAASTGHPSRCAIWLSMQMQECFDRFAACLYNRPKRYGQCYSKALACAARAEANYLKCVAKYD